MDIKDKYIVLTGASGGIGQATAHALAKRGANLVLVARNTQKLEALRRSPRSFRHHECVAADLTTTQGMDTLRLLGPAYLQQGKRISVIINNAGSNQFQLLAQRLPESVEKEIRLNLLSPIQVTQTALAWLSHPELS